MTTTEDADRQMPEISWEEALEKYEFVDRIVDDTGNSVAVIMADRTSTTNTNSNPAYAEIGSTSPSTYLSFLRQEYNPDLRETQGLRTYDKMRRSDSTVRGTLRLMKTPVLAARWFVKPASDSPKDKKIADFVSWNLFKGMTNSWPQLLTETLLQLEFGYYMFEKVWTSNHPMKPGMVCWQKFAPRHPLDVIYWEFDDKGGPSGVQMYNYSVLTQVLIPIDKLAVFTFDKEGGDMTGLSLLRSAYKPWYYKQQLEKIDAIQKERHGIGIPIIKLPPGFSPGDRALADQLGRNLRTNERAHVVLPPNWDILFAKLEGQPVSSLDSLNYHDNQIMMNVLGTFLGTAEARTHTGKDDDRTLFIRSTRFLAQCVADVFNSYCIPQLVDYNFSRVPNGYPELCARRIGEEEQWRTTSFTVRNLVGAGVLTPDDELEDALREETDLPPRDPKTARNIASPQGAPIEGQATAPQAAAGAGAQRPAPANQQRGVSGANVPSKPAPSPAQAPRQNPSPVVAVPRGNAGVDRSGGK
jgi:hypothetical protein